MLVYQFIFLFRYNTGYKKTMVIFFYVKARKVDLWYL